jgi:acyl carrier protein
MILTRDDVATTVKEILANLLEQSVVELDDATDLEEMGVDSLMFLEAFEQVKLKYDLTLDLTSLRAYLRQNPVSTLGAMISGLHELILCERAEPERRSA